MLTLSGAWRARASLLTPHRRGEDPGPEGQSRLGRAISWMWKGFLTILCLAAVSLWGSASLSDGVTIGAMMIFLLNQYLCSTAPALRLQEFLARLLLAPLRALLEALSLPDLLTGQEEAQEIDLLVPVTLTLAQGTGPTLRWALRRGEAADAGGALIEAPGRLRWPASSPQDGALELAPGAFAVALSRDPEDPFTLCLELRALRGEARLLLAADPDDFSPEGLAGLPLLRREGIGLDASDRRALLLALAEIAQAQGVAMPALAVEEAEG